MTLALYEISSQYKEALEKLGDMDLPDEVVQQTLEGLSGDLKVKAMNVACFAKNIEVLAESIAEAEKKMAHRRKVLENKAQSIKDYIKTCMESAGVSKIECPEFCLSVKKNPPSVEIVDEVEIPDVYKKTSPPPPPVPDKNMIGEILKAGTDVPGARLKQGTRLEIR